MLNTTFVHVYADTICNNIIIYLIEASQYSLDFKIYKPRLPEQYLDTRKDAENFREINVTFLRNYNATLLISYNCWFYVKFNSSLLKLTHTVILGRW